MTMFFQDDVRAAINHDSAFEHKIAEVLGGEFDRSRDFQLTGVGARWKLDVPRQFFPAGNTVEMSGLGAGWGRTRRESRLPERNRNNEIERTHGKGRNAFIGRLILYPLPFENTNYSASNRVRHPGLFGGTTSQSSADAQERVPPN